MMKSDYVKMEISYLKAWRTFSKRCEEMVPILHELTYEDTDVSSQLVALRALSAIKRESRQIRDKIFQRLNEASQDEFTSM